MLFDIVGKALQQIRQERYSLHVKNEKKAIRGEKNPKEVVMSTHHGGETRGHWPFDLQD